MKDTPITSFLSVINGFAYMKPHKYSLLIQHGRHFEPQPRPKGWRRMKPKECYHNAGKLAVRHDGVFYCEGYATTVAIPIPLEHGWLCTKDGKVIDPTWEDGNEYFGICFNSEFVLMELMRTRMYGIFHLNTNPILFKKGNVKVWKQRL